MTLQLIETKVLGSAQASIEFTSIPQDGTDIVFLMSTRSDRATGSVSDVYITFNNTTANYSSRHLVGTGSSAVSGTGPTDKFYFFDTSQATMTANTFGNSSIYIPNYTGSTNKSVSVDHVFENNATLAYQVIAAGLWSNTAAITSVKFAIIAGANYAVGTTISLYKITKGSSGGVVVS